MTSLGLPPNLLLDTSILRPRNSKLLREGEIPQFYSRCQEYSGQDNDNTAIDFPPCLPPSLCMRKFPRSLLLALNEGRVLPFVGAGVSRAVRDQAGQAAFPNWFELLERSAQRLVDEHKTDAAQGVRGCLNSNPPNLLGAAEIARRALRGRLWGDFMREQFDPPIATIDRSTFGLAEAIWSLQCPLVITTNYDRVMEWTSLSSEDCQRWGTDAPAEHARVLDGRSTKPAIWHLHGTIHQLDQIILTTGDYNRLYPSADAEVQLASALATLRSLLAIKTFVFFGFGFNDERFLHTILSVVETYRSNVGPHYAFVHRDDIPRLESMAHELCLELLPFESFGAPLVTMVRDLGQARGRALPPLTNPPVAPAPEESPESAVDLRPGLRLGRRYRIEQRLGHGGFATVWKALDEHTGTAVAVKVLHTHLSQDSERVQRFERGAARMGALRHPNIVQVLAPVAYDGPYRYFVMELLYADLATAVRSIKLPEDYVIRIVGQLGDALCHAHSQGLIHRDVKPSNVLVDTAGTSKLTDFDLVLALDSSGGTRTGALGTFLFAAPEVIADPGSANETADVFGLAMTAVFLFHAAPMGPEAYRNAGEFIERHLSCSGALKSVLARACSWQRERRQQSIAEFCAHLNHAASLPRPPVRPPSVVAAGSIPGPPRRPSPSLSDTDPAWARPDSSVNIQASESSAGTSILSEAPPLSRRPQMIGYAVLLASAVIGMIIWQAPVYIQEILASEPESPEPSETKSPQPERPRPIQREGNLAYENPAAKRLQLPPTGSARGVTRIALRDDSPIRLIELTGGEFTLGSPVTETFHATDEPQRRVKLDPFLLAESEVTLRQWQAIMGNDPGSREYGAGLSHPIQGVNWFRALDFLNRLSQREGRTPCYKHGDGEPVWVLGCDGFRLPTEAEFEYAIRAGTTTAYSFGDDSGELRRFAWFADNSGGGPQPVRKLAPNPWGFYDIHGNVWEWVWDYYGKSYPSSISSRYHGPESGDLRVLRGGSFDDSIKALRAANRAGDKPTRGGRFRGLRVAMDLR